MVKRWGVYRQSSLVVYNPHRWKDDLPIGVTSLLKVDSNTSSSCKRNEALGFRAVEEHREDCDISGNDVDGECCVESLDIVYAAA